MEALTDSNEVISAKKVRTAAKGALTRVANQLKKVLVLKPGEKYDFLKLDKFSLEADAEKLKKNLEALQNANDRYATVGRGLLEGKNVASSVLDNFDDTVEAYWTESRQEATELLNLYKFEYTTALNRYLKNIDEEGKPTITTSAPTTADLEKSKKKIEGDVQRQMNRWGILKAEWNCQLEQGEKLISETKELQLNDLLLKPLLFAPDALIT